MAVTDAEGRYAMNLPEGSSATLLALHPMYAGPGVKCEADQRTIPPVKLEAAGRVVGTAVDTTNGRPGAGARLHASRIERYDNPLLATQWTTTDEQGRCRIGGLPPGVYNVYLDESPRGERFPAAAVEGVRVEGGLEANAGLKLVQGRRIEGTVIDARTGQPMAGTEVLCSNSALPSSGHEGRSMKTDEKGRFVFFVPPGCRASITPARKILKSVRLSA